MRDQSLLNPFMPDDPLMAGAWIGAFSYALGRGEIMHEFRKATGNNWTPAKSGLEQMIDDASGAEAEFFVQFAGWFNEHVWGIAMPKKEAANG